MILSASDIRRKGFVCRLNQMKQKFEGDFFFVDLGWIASRSSMGRQRGWISQSTST